MIYLSASLIKDVLQCTKKAYWRRNYSELSQQTPTQEIGSEVHKCLETHWDKNLKDMEMSLAGSKVIRENMDIIHIYLKNYVDNFKVYCGKDDKIEEKFSFPIQSNYTIVGKLDRVNSNTGLVLDWKTTKSPPISVDNDIQFMLYDWAFEKQYGKIANLVGYASLKTGKLIKYKRNDAYLNELFSEIIPRVISILENNLYSRDGIFSALYGRQSNTCLNCMFKNVCLV